MDIKVCDSRLLILIIIIGLGLRVANLESVPPWDWDEAGNIEYAKNLANGQVSYFAYRYHFIAHPPVYFMVLAPFVKFLGAKILFLRLLNVAMSTAAIVYAYKIGKKWVSPFAAYIGALSFALMPEAIFWGRLGYANNLLGLMGIAIIYHLRYGLEGDQKHFMKAAALTSLAPLVEYTGVAYVLAYTALIAVYAKDQVKKTAHILCTPTLVFTALMLAFDGKGFTEDALNYFGLYPLFTPFILAFGFIFWKKTDWIRSKAQSLRFDLSGRYPYEVAVIAVLGVLAALPLDSGFFYEGRLTSYLFIASINGLFFLRDERLRLTGLFFIGAYLLQMSALNRSDHMSIPLIYLVAPFIAPIY